MRSLGVGKCLEWGAMNSREGGVTVGGDGGGQIFSLLSFQEL